MAVLENISLTPSRSLWSITQQSQKCGFQNVGMASVFFEGWGGEYVAPQRRAPCPKQLLPFPAGMAVTPKKTLSHYFSK